MRKDAPPGTNNTNKVNGCHCVKEFLYVRNFKWHSLYVCVYVLCVCHFGSNSQGESWSTPPINDHHHIRLAVERFGLEEKSAHLLPSGLVKFCFTQQTTEHARSTSSGRHCLSWIEGAGRTTHKAAHPPQEGCAGSRSIGERGRREPGSGVPLQQTHLCWQTSGAMKKGRVLQRSKNFSQFWTLKEFLHWYLSPEMRDPNGTGVSTAHRRSHPADRGSRGE